MHANLRQDMEFEASKLIHSMWAAEKRQEELDQEKKMGKKRRKKDKMKPKKSTPWEQKNSLEGVSRRENHK